MNGYINKHLQNILASAQKGETSYMIDTIEINDQNTRNTSNVRPWEVTPTVDEMSEALLVKFPGCKISYEEKWISITPTKQQLKKGILIDWS